MAPLQQHVALLPVLAAALLVSVTAGRSGGGPVAPALLQPTSQVSTSTSTGSVGGLLEEKNQHPAGKEKEEQPLRLSQKRRFQRRRWRMGRGNAQQPGIMGGKSTERSSPFAKLAGVGDGLRARARRLLVAEMEGRQKHDAGAPRRRQGFGRRSRESLAFGNFGARKQWVKEEEEEVISAEMLARTMRAWTRCWPSSSPMDGNMLPKSPASSSSGNSSHPLPRHAPSSSSSSSGGIVDEEAAAKFACVKAMGTLDARASDLYKLFLDNERVHEYNDNCKEVRDLERLSDDTKVSWACTPRYRPFKARDFVTAVHYRTLEDGTMMVVNRPVEHPAARRGKKYVRAEILIATNIMRPNREDPSKTDFISVTHINPGGIADSRIGAKIVNKLCAKAPVNLLVALERSANSAPVPREEVAAAKKKNVAG
ncbi:unnamed protein product [Ectocarpus sp. CCAP 1310/34]|nr:unnamed protein product [Ectocarpus sp. CCAP 1310/34]